MVIEGGEFVVPEEVEEIERSASEIERAARRLGSEDASIDDLATVAREGRRIIETATDDAGTAPDEPEPEPDAER